MALARIKSFTPEQGFGYIEHPEHGDLLFDFESCNFTPEVGDEVDVVEIKEGYKGRLKAARVVCPAKPAGDKGTKVR